MTEKGSFNNSMKKKTIPNKDYKKLSETKVFSNLNEKTHISVFKEGIASIND